MQLAPYINHKDGKGHLKDEVVPLFFNAAHDKGTLYALPFSPYTEGLPQMLVRREGGEQQRYEINAHGFRMVSTMITLVRAASIAIFFIYNMVLFYLVVFMQATENIFAENGFMEMSQALLLASTSVIFLISWRQLEKHHKFVLLSCSLLCLTFLFRELDVADFDLPHFLIVMGSGTGRNIILSTAWVFIAIGAFLNWKYYRGKLTLYFFSKTGILLMVGAGFLLVGAFFDHEVIKVSYYKFYEELAELNGYYFLFLGALVSRASLQGIANRPSR